jgi:hypothetical protein
MSNTTESGKKRREQTSSNHPTSKRVRFDPIVKSFINGITTILGNENGYHVSKRGIKRGLPPFTDSTLHSLGKFLGKYDLSYRTETDTEGNTKYIFTTGYGDPDNPAEYHELWWNPIEESDMKKVYRYAVKQGLEPLYTYATGKNAQEAAEKLHDELMKEYASEEGTSTKGGRRTHKQKRNRNRKQKTKKQRTNRK